MFFFILQRFCESSTIHGTFFWSESATIYGKIIWVAIVVLGISGSGWIIDNSFKVKTNLGYINTGFGVFKWGVQN